MPDPSAPGSAKRPDDFSVSPTVGASAGRSAGRSVGARSVSTTSTPRLALETGDVFRGRWFGGAWNRPGAGDATHVAAGGEIVFQTGMTGYQEILTDPSYAGQIVVFTAAHIGNYGIHAGEDESERIHPSGMVVRDHCERTFHQRADRDLDDVLRRAQIPALSDVDTRAVTTILRESGACRAVLGIGHAEDLVAEARALAPIAATNWVAQVTCAEPWTLPARPKDTTRATFRVTAFDYGVKRSILERLREEGCELTVVPADARAEDVLAGRLGPKPDGIFLSNGPGDPAMLDAQVAEIRVLLDAGLPVFGICLGHQLLGRALGGETFKLPFGHHGANHPVLREDDGRVEITSHNHNYAIRRESMDTARIRFTHRSLNDECVEGLEVLGRPIYSVQYHPEAAPGPRDGAYLFGRFVRDMTAHREAAGGA